MGRNAGIPAIGVNWGYHPAENLTKAGAHVVLGCFGVKYDVASREGELHKVYLHPAVRGRGTAQKLMAKALAWLGQTHPECEAVMLWTDTRFEAGHRFYGKCGFARTGESRILDDLSNSSEWQFRFDFAAYQRALGF